MPEQPVLLLGSGHQVTPRQALGHQIARRAHHDDTGGQQENLGRQYREVDQAACHHHPVGQNVGHADEKACDVGDVVCQRRLDAGSAHLFQHADGCVHHAVRDILPKLRHSAHAKLLKKYLRADSGDERPQNQNAEVPWKLRAHVLAGRQGSIDLRDEQDTTNARGNTRNGCREQQPARSSDKEDKHEHPDMNQYNHSDASACEMFRPALAAVLARGAPRQPEQEEPVNSRGAGPS